MQTMKQLRGKKIWHLTPSPSGFGEYECNGAVFVRKDSIRLCEKLDGLVRNQTGPCVVAETWDGEQINGMLP